jgi:hypothetical protein
VFNLKHPLNLNGYVVIYVPDHPKAFKPPNRTVGYYYEHIVVMEQLLGRSMADDEVIHHLDFDRSNNDLNNLLMLTRASHSKLHEWLRLQGIDADNVMKRVTKVRQGRKKGWFDGMSDGDLVELYLALPHWGKLGAKFNVSDNAIRRVFVKRNLLDRIGK